MEKPRILVVDDDKKWLKTIQLIFGDRYSLIPTTDPDEAVSNVRSSFFSLAILDQHISSDVSGSDLLTHMREIQPGLCGVILTGYAGLEDAVSSMKVAGVSDYVSKGHPNLAGRLLSCVESALQRNPQQIPIPVLIAQGESADLEFKSSVRWDFRQNKVNRDLSSVIVKTVAAFLNSEKGGTLLIGVADSGEIIGLEHDYMTLHRRDRDGFQASLFTLVLDSCGKDLGNLILIDFHEVQGKDVCRVVAKPAHRPVYVREKDDEQLYVRMGNSSRPLSMREAVDYCKMRWK